MRKILGSGLINAVAAAALMSVLGCAQGTGEGNTPEQPQSLRDVQIPQDFTFATSRAVSVTVSANAETLGAETGALEVARADGRVLYRGPLSVSQPLSLNLSVPTKDDVVKLRLSANGQEHTADVSLGANGGTYTF